MLRRQGLPPSCPHPRNGSCPWNFRFPSCPAHRADGIHRHWAVAFYAAATSQWKASKTENISPSLEYRSSSGITIMRKSGAGPKGGFKKAGHRASLRAVRVEGTTALLRRAKGFGPLAAGGASFLHRGRRQFRHKTDTCGQFLKLEMRLRKITHLYAPGFPGSSLTSTRASRSG